MSIFPGMRSHKFYMVYRWDQEKSKKVPVGLLEERRAGYREENELGMLRLAREKFAASKSEFPNISIHMVSS